jgi:hypothetical protein
MVQREQRQAPSGPKNVVVKRLLIGAGAPPIAPQDTAGFTTQAFTGTDVVRGDVVSITANSTYPGLTFRAVIFPLLPNLVTIGVLAQNFTAAPVGVPPDGFDLTIAITRGVREAPTP